VKYHDSIEQSEQIKKQVVAKLRQWQLPINPINYAVSYEYCKNSNPLLIASIKCLLLSGKALDGFFMEQLYKDYFLEQSKFRHDIISDIAQLFEQLQQGCQKSTLSAQGLIDNLDDNIPALMSSNKEEVKTAITKLHRASIAFKKEQQQLAEQLQASQQHTKALEIELEQVRQEIYLDPVTGLYNHKAMSKHLDTWLTQDANRTVAAIVVSVDYFSTFNERFGELIGDVILSKIAKKVASYVDDSGLPVRSASDEFIVLMPDVDGGIASEIAEKIKQGIEKLRFVSVQSGVRLPKMSVSLGVGEMQKNEGLNQFINRSRRTKLS
jgi:diguanylate cyclase